LDGEKSTLGSCNMQLATHNLQRNGATEFNVIFAEG